MFRAGERAEGGRLAAVEDCMWKLAKSKSAIESAKVLKLPIASCSNCAVAFFALIG